LRITSKTSSSFKRASAQDVELKAAPRDPHVVSVPEHRERVGEIADRDVAAGADEVDECLDLHRTGGASLGPIRVVGGELCRVIAHAQYRFTKSM
jgi:hypothetical protein